MSTYVASIFYAAIAALSVAAFVDLGDALFAAVGVFFALVSQIVHRA